MPKDTIEVPCREIEIFPDDWIMTTEANNKELIILSKNYNIDWKQHPCLKGVMETDVTPELEEMAFEQIKYK